MSTSMTETEIDAAETPDPDYDPSIADVRMLEDKLPDWFRLPAISAGFTFLIGLTYFFFDRLQPIAHTDVWGHLSYGRQLWQTGILPSTEPLMPLSLGVPFVNSAWLSQLIAYAGYLVVGKAAITFLFSACVAGSLAVLTRRIYSRTHSAMFALGGFVLTVWVEYQQLIVQRPQIAGFLFYAVLLSILLRREWSNRTWVVVPVMFAFWANMHGSFIVGLALLGCFAIGRGVDLLRRTGQLASLFHDSRLRRLVLLTELSAVAALLNPYGLSLYSEVLSFGNNPNLQSIIEWQSLHLRLAQGQAATVAALILFIVYRVSPRRVSTAEVLSLVVFGATAMWTSRMLVWWGPLAGCFAAIHAGAAWRKWQEWEVSPEPPPRASLWTIVVMGIMFIFFELSNLGTITLAMAAGKDIEKVTSRIPVSRLTPVAATEYLNEHPPTGLVFCTYEWGDYLMWAGPKDMKVFVASHCHLVPENVWDDYMGIVQLQGSWSAMLARYGINTVVIDQQYREPMIHRLQEDKEWKLKFMQDGQAVFERVNPIEIDSKS
ncbi:MAG: hypothetical protein HQ518_19935 [Rhodopirellula sp.]|nr:hypothetical protein [Rhodopirellula sp.]